MENKQSKSTNDPIIILANPQLGENIGAVARVMLNFGLKELRIVNPRDGWPNPKALTMATAAKSILNEAKIYMDLTSALNEIEFVYATSARKRDINKLVVSPRNAILDVVKRVRQKQRVAIIFGPERTGLENKQLVLANEIIEIPVNPSFKSINLSQSVAVICYEWMCTCQEVDDNQLPSKKLADLTAKSRFVELLINDLETKKFFWPKEKSAVMKLNLQNLFLRMDLTMSEVGILHKIRRNLERRKN